MADRLSPDEALGPGQWLESPNGRAQLAMQSDGNLVLYAIGATGSAALWATNTQLPGSKVVMQGDGNLALYGPGGDCRWAAGTHGNPGAWLALQDDGNLVIYAGGGPALWASGTTLPPEIVIKGDRLGPDQALEPGEAIESPNRRAVLVMRREGNLVLFEGRGGLDTAYWDVGTDVPGSRLVMQGDGNLALYEPGGVCRWASGTDGNPGAWVVLQDDGNLVVYSAGGQALWASGAPSSG
jgi:hypothetical protein